MAIDDYEAFCRVVEAGGYAAAARAHSGSKSALSTAVLRLEGSLGMRLLVRNTRRVKLTDGGERLYRRIAPLLRQLHDVHERARADAASVAGMLRIATPYEFGAHHLAAIVCELLARHDELDVQIDVRHDAIDPFAAPYDVVFSMAETELAATNAIAKRVFTLERGLFAAPALLAARGRPREPADLADLPLLATPADRDWRFSRQRRRDQRLAINQPRMRSSSAEVRRHAALAGLGVARITATYCAEQVRDGLLCRVLPEWRCAPLPVYALFTERRLMAPKVRALLDAFDSSAVNRAAAVGST